MSESCETVKVKTSAPGDNEQGFVVINKTDFDPKVHVLHEDKPVKAKKADKE